MLFEMRWKFVFFQYLFAMTALGQCCFANGQKRDLKDMCIFLKHCHLNTMLCSTIWALVPEVLSG